MALVAAELCAKFVELSNERGVCVETAKTIANAVAQFAHRLEPVYFRGGQSFLAALKAAAGAKTSMVQPNEPSYLAATAYAAQSTRSCSPACRSLVWYGLLYIVFAMPIREVRVGPVTIASPTGDADAERDREFQAQSYHS